ncbi:carboxypeptidase-like regulatory domain-containing protein [Thermococcus sp. AM4]|uniref:carboxypeptidase-like regulatory domain-containing protein n=1 Tax=Thermococcus sp. (strain AM4) TaxID=246969 RepID=UPI001ED8CB51|nr:carboxypeptidase-like regulatory domain-containing protein [Thermococcus sp. AM4]
MYYWTDTAGNIGSPYILNFTVKDPFNVTITSIHSEIPYNDSGTWKYDKAFAYIPFNLTVNVTYDPNFVNYSPSSQIVSIILPNGSVKEVPVTLVNGTGVANVSVDGVKAGSIGVTSTSGVYTYSNPNAGVVHSWHIETEIDKYTYNADTLTQPYKYVPFNATINVTALSDAGELLGVNDTIIAEVSGAVEEHGPYSGAMINGTGQVTLTDIRVDPATVLLYLGNYTAINTTFTLTASEWVISADYNVTYVGNQVSDRFYINVPANLTVNVTYNLPVNVSSNNVNYTIKFPNGLSIPGNFNVTNNTGNFTVEIPSDYVNELGNVVVIINDTYYHVSKIITIPIENWSVSVVSHEVLYTGNTQSDPNFYINVPANLTFQVHYNIPILLNSTNVNYRIIVPGIATPITGVFNITNGVAIVNVNASMIPSELGNVTVIINDTTYSRVSEPYKIPVKDWNVSGAYIVYHYGNPAYPDRVFYIGIPASLYVNATFENITINLDSGVIVEVYGPDGTLVRTKRVTITSNFGEDILDGLQFDQLGYVTVKIYNSTYRILDTLRIPVRDWGIYVDSTPENLTVNEPTSLTVEIRESLYFPGAKDVNVTLYLPDGTVKQRTVTLVGSSYGTNGGYYGVVTFGNVTSTEPGIAKVVVTDSGKEAVKLIPVFPQGGRLYLEVTAPELYKYVPAELTVKVMNYTGSTPTYFNITVYDPNGDVIYTKKVLYNSNVPVFEIPVTVDQAGNITIVVMDEGGNFMGVYKVPVHDWSVTFDWTLPSRVYKWVPASGSVSVSTVPDEPVTIELYRNGELVYSGSDLTIPFDIPTENDTVNYTVKVYYNGHLVGSDERSITIQSWNVTVDVSPSEVYKWVPSDVSVSVEPTISAVDASELEVYVNGQPYTGPFSVELENNTNYTITVYYHGHLIKNITKTITVENWSVSIEPSTTWIYKYVPTTVTFTATPSIDAVSASELEITPESVIIDDTTNVTVTVKYRGHVIKTEEIPITAKEWNAQIDYYTDKPVYEGVPVTVYIDQYNEPGVQVNVTIYKNGIPVTQGIDSAEFTIENPQGTMVYEINVTYRGHVVGHRVISLTAKPWGIYINTYPEKLKVGERVNLSVHITSDRVGFDGLVKVTLVLPDGTVMSLTRTLAYDGSQQEATIVLHDVVSEKPGLAKVIVTDELSGKEFVKYIPVYPNGEITGRWIDVKVTPEKSPVYAYVENSLRIDAQYYYNMGDGAYKDDVNSYVNITIIDADGSVYKLNNVPVINGVISIPNYPLPVNGTGSIYVMAVDAFNSSIMGFAEIPVEDWKVTFDINTNGPVYQYVDNILKVTVHVPAGVPVDVNVSGQIFTGVTDGQVISIPIVDPTSDINVNVVAKYHNAVAGKDYVVGSASKTIELRGWHVEITYTPKVIYTHIPATLTVNAIAVDNETGETLPFDLKVGLFNETLSLVAVETNTVSIPIQDDTGAGLTYFVTVNYGAHEMVSYEPILIDTHDWAIEVTKTITSSAYSGTDYLWAGVPAQITFSVVTYDLDTNAPVSLPVSIPINVTYNGYTYTGTDSITINLASPEPASEAFHVEAAYQDISYVNDFIVPVKDWSIYVNAYPSKLYADLPQQLTLIIGYSAGIESVATVDVGGTTYTAHVEPVGEDSAIAVVNVGEVVASEGYLRVTVTDQYGKTATLKIPVVSWDIAVTSNVNFVYTNVSTDITVDVHYSDSMLDGNANVYLVLPDGTMLTKTATILDGKGQVTFTGVVADRAGNITIYAEDVASGKKSGNITIEVHDWHMEVNLTPTEWYTYLPHDYIVGIKYIDDVTGGIANIDSTVEVSYNLTGVTGSELVNVTGGQGEVTFTGLATENAGVGTFTVTDAAHGKSGTVNVTIHGWTVKVTYPEKLFVAPGYRNPVVVGFAYIADDNSTVPYTGNTTVTIELPGNFTRTLNVNASPADFGQIKLNQTGVGTITVFANDYPEVNFTGTIQVENLLEMSLITKRIYENVPTDIVVNITYNGGDYHNLEVYIEGQNITLTTTNGQIWTAEVSLPAGNYTVVAYDPVYNVTVTDTFHVAPWHLEIVPSTTSISAGNLEEVNFTVRAIDDETNTTADIDALIHIQITFSNSALIPNGTFEVADFNLVNGEYTFTESLFAPAPGNFTVKAMAVDYGKCAKTIIQVTEPTVPPTYAYIKVYKQGTLEVPNDTVVLYWSVDGKTYFPAYDAKAGRIAEINTAENNEIVLTLYPTNQFTLYIIAVPKFIADKYPILTSEPIDTRVTHEYVWYNYSITSVNGTIKAKVVAYKKTITEGWTYQIPEAPGYISVIPPASVQGVAPYTGYQYVYKEELANETNCTKYTFTFEPTEFIKFKKLSTLSIQPAQYGSYFEFEAILYEKYLNMSGQFDEQFKVFEDNVKSMVSSLQFLSDDQKQELIDEIINEALGYKDEIIGAYPQDEIPISGAEVQFHIDNPAIAYLEPVNATTDENGIAKVKVYSAAPKDATPEELVKYMGSVTVWATYDNMTSENYTVSFGGIGSISGDVVDPNNNLLPGAKVELWINDNGQWVIAKDYAGNNLTTITDGHGHYSFNVPAAPQGTAYRVVAYYGDGTGYADVVVYPFKTSTADVVVTTYETTNVTGLGAFLSDAQTHDVKIVLGKNALTSVDYHAMDFLLEYIGVKPVYSDSDINVDSLSASDMIIAVGGPEVNSITAYYQKMTPVRMVTNADGSISIIVNNETVANWTAPSPWWNVTKGYWVIQRVVDPDTGAVVYMIYGTDADSTWAAAYYFSKHFSELNNVNYVVGCWKDTDNMIYSPAFLKFASDDKNGFSPTDKIGVIVEG